MERRVRLTNGLKVDTSLQELELNTDELMLVLGGECEGVSIRRKRAASGFSGGMYGLRTDDAPG